MRRLLFVFVLLALAPWAHAQRMISNAPHFSPGFNPGFSRGGHSHSFFYPIAFGDPFYSGYAAPQPSVVILQTPPAADAPVAEPAPTPAQPLMIELRGDRYVRVSGADSSVAEILDPALDAGAQPQPIRPGNAGALRKTAGSPPQPSVLVFRDGQREEVSAYTIANGMLYASSNYYTSGAWTKTIALSSLNLPETITSNQSRGIRFQLPSAPNEVLVVP
jgi:hypothetical protein